MEALFFVVGVLVGVLVAALIGARVVFTAVGAVARPIADAAAQVGARAELLRRELELGEVPADSRAHVMSSPELATAPQEPLQVVLAAEVDAANDAFPGVDIDAAHARRGPQEPAGRSRRPCELCAKVRRALGLRPL